jgi:peptidoglycan LD-endopeptidase LytH
VSYLPKLRAVLRPVGCSPARRWLGLGALLSVLGCAALHAESFQLPTANRTLLAPGQEEQFYVGTVGKLWTSGTFGCVRTSGTQLHEGLDIRSVQRNPRGEPTDPVLATASGSVAYINTRPSLSAYGIYVILRHAVDGLEIYSLYAHLSRVADGLSPGQRVQAGQPIAVMGRSANTRQSISLERAHLHFELGLLINEHYPQWHRKTYPKGVNDHGPWNGLNLAGLDPEPVLLEQYRRGPQFSLLNFVRCQTELFRVVVRATQFPWLHRYPALVQRNPVAERQGVAGYEITFNFNGVPFHLVPRAPSELHSRSPVHLLSVNESESRLRPCRKFVVKKGGRWELANNGITLIQLLTF